MVEVGFYRSVTQVTLPKKTEKETADQCHSTPKRTSFSSSLGEEELFRCCPTYLFPTLSESQVSCVQVFRRRDSDVTAPIENGFKALIPPREGVLMGVIIKL
jgi:hypothetical protein